MRTHGRQVLTGVLTVISMMIAAPASAQEKAPRSWVASPDVYKVIGESEKTKIKVILGTWPPGKRDNWHSHAPNGVYFVTDCAARLHSPDGKFQDSKLKAGGAGVQPATASHSFENRGTSECKVVITEEE
jgi:quercetin dioxygenase-like cupin family protein